MTEYSFILTGNKWQSNTITYTFDDIFLDVVDDRRNTINSFSNSHVSNVTDGNSSLGIQAMALWASVANLTFSAASTAETADVAILAAAVTPDEGWTAWSVANNTTTLNGAASFIEANMPLYLYIHEIGHALGLDHPGHGDGSASGYSRDTTIMSYNWGVYTSASRLPITPMLYDIAAIQSLYGINSSTDSGNTTHTFTGNSVARTIWDAASVDTLDASDRTSTVKLDLREGFDGSTQYVNEVGDERVFLAYHANIENAKGGSGNDIIHGNDAKAGETIGAAIYAAFDGKNLLDGGEGHDQLFGHGGDDTLIGGVGNDTLDGGEDENEQDFDIASFADLSQRIIFDVANNAVTSGSDVDTLTGIEAIVGTASEQDIANFTGIGAPKQRYTFLRKNIDGTDYTEVSIKGVGVVTHLSSIERLEFGSLNEEVRVQLTPVSDVVQEIHMGGGNDTVLVMGTPQGYLPQIFLGDGNDYLRGASKGSVVYGGAGEDIFGLSNDSLIADATVDDRLMWADKILTGGMRWETDESPWVKGAQYQGGIRYGLNGDGELVVRDANGLETFVANFSNVLDGPHILGILLVQLAMDSYMVVREARGYGQAKLYESFEATLGYATKALTGMSGFASVKDPLVLDLDGDGLELLARTSISPMFDIDGDGFAEKTGWVYGDDGFLARDLNSNGIIDDVSELFGNTTQSGFEALAEYDSNEDDVVDASDTDFATLRIWQDVDGDGITDAGELLTLAQAGIASINVTPDDDEDVTISGNTVTAQGTFTRTDTTTGVVADVNFLVNDRDTVWLGDSTVDTAAAALPEVKGYGTLANLRIAMTLDADVKTAMQTALPTLNTLDLATLRGAITPVLTAWAEAIPVPSGTAGTVTRGDVPILTATSIGGGVTVIDYAFRVMLC